MLSALASSSSRALFRAPARAPAVLARGASSSAAAAAASTSSSSSTPASPAAAQPTLRLPYAVERTASGELPVYTDIKNGRTLVKTVIRKVHGDQRALRDDLQQFLDDGHIDPIKPAPTVTVRPTNGHVEVKGRAVAEIKQWLEMRGF